MVARPAPRMSSSVSRCPRRCSVSVVHPGGAYPKQRTTDSCAARNALPILGDGGVDRRAEPSFLCPLDQ